MIKKKSLKHHYLHGVVLSLLGWHMGLKCSSLLPNLTTTTCLLIQQFSYQWHMPSVFCIFVPKQLMEKECLLVAGYNCKHPLKHVPRIRIWSVFKLNKWLSGANSSCTVNYNITLLSSRRIDLIIQFSL